MSTSLGRFMSRDPDRQVEITPSPEDGYSDGYNLYAAYFIPNGMDPSGMARIPTEGAPCTKPHTVEFGAWTKNAGGCSATCCRFRIIMCYLHLQKVNVIGDEWVRKRFVCNVRLEWQQVGNAEVECDIVCPDSFFQCEEAAHG